MWALLMTTTQAQQILFNRTAQLRLTVPVGSTGTYILTNTVTINTNGASAFDGTGTNWVIGAVTLTATGVPSLPSGLTLNITDPSGNPLSTFTKTLNTNSASSSTNMWLQVTATSVPAGTYTISLNGSATGGATNHLLFTVQVGHLWNGKTNAIVNGSDNWSASGSWLGGVPGSDAGPVVFIESLTGQTNICGQTNIYDFSSITTNFNVALTNSTLFRTTNLVFNSIVDGSYTLESLRFGTTNSVNFMQSLNITPNNSLTITGANGFSMLRDYVSAFQSGVGQMRATIAGTNASLIVTNRSANFALVVDANQVNLDLSYLDTFKGSVNLFSIGAFSGYPNWYNLNANNYGGAPRAYLVNWLLAKTNVLTAYGVDQYNYTNGSTRTYSFTFMSTVEGSGQTGQATCNTVLGISNQFFMDSINFIGPNQQGNLAFNPMLAGAVVNTNITLTSTNYSVSNTVPMYAYFRNTNGGRMSCFAITDAAGTNDARGNGKANIDFGSANGNLDLLVDRFFIGRDRPAITPGQGPNYQGVFVMGNGIVDANTVVLGYREYPGAATNNWASWNGYCEGRVTVSNGVFKVNNSMTLGYNTETNLNGLGSGGNTTFGQLNVFSNGTVMANTIIVGGPPLGANHMVGGSANNNIVVDIGGTLIVSNTVASTNQLLDSFTVQNGSTLVLHLDGANTNSRVFTTNFVTAGANKLRIAQLKNMTFPSTIPLITYKPASAPEAHASAFTAIVPSGITGILSDDQPPGFPNTLYHLQITLTTGTPKNLLWRGGNGTWDTSTKNWLDQSTLVMTNFSTGDIVAFDDVSGSTISLDSASSPLYPGGISMTNRTTAFVISGPGYIYSGVQLNKWGTNSLEIDAITTAAVQLHQGILLGSGGSIGGATLSTNTTMYFAGDVNGALDCAGTATLLNSANGVNGSLAVRKSGIVTNQNTITGTPALDNGAFFYNSGSVNFAVGTMTVSSNATFINAGFISGNNITINGLFEDTGAGNISLLSQLQFADGAQFIPGGDGIGATTVFPSGNSSLAGRVTFLTGSTNIFKVNFDSGDNYTVLLSAEQDFGPSSGQPNYNGGTLLITNTGVTPWIAGKNLRMIRNSDDGGASDLFGVTGSATNSYPIMVPTAPGPNLAWNIQDIVRTGRVKTIGVNTNPAAVVLASTTQVLQNIFTNSFTTNGVVITPNVVTNNVLFANLNWPSDRTGWKLQTQVNPLSIGLSTNWSTVFGSPWTSSMTLSNIFSSSNTVFYRLVYP